LTSHPTDDGFHEIQLNGKQLVFLFMAATVVSVVIFLCGVLVGRGVRAEQAVADAALEDVPMAEQTTGSSALSGPDPRAAAPPTTVGDLSYAERLGKPDQGLDELKPPASKPPVSDTRQISRVADPPAAADAPPVSIAPPAPAVPPAAKPTAKPAPPPPAAVPPVRPAASGAASSAKPGYVVQLAALNSRREADAMVKRLSAKGYEAFVQAPATGAPSIFRVRVGNYSTRSEAETAAAKLEKEGQFKPWVAAR
jgi:cell division septation protein DedD